VRSLQIPGVENEEWKINLMGKRLRPGKKGGKGWGEGAAAASLGLGRTPFFFFKCLLFLFFFYRFLVMIFSWVFFCVV
jgi:hypothetical protein